MQAYLHNYHQAPRKVRLVGDLLKGKKVTVALAELDFLSKRASAPIKKLIKSAVANAKQNFGVDEADLSVKNLTVDKGNVMKRYRPASRGRAHQIIRRMSHIKVVLETAGVSAPVSAKAVTKKAAVKTKSEPKAVKKVAKKSVAKKKAE